jgi:clorobiocin/coumermycin A biosynthesis protein CloN6/CouN6
MKLDVMLCHAPSVYDFRDRDDVLFAYLSNSDSVHISPIFEMPPVGIYSIKQHLNKSGFKSEFFNIASQMLRHPDFDVENFFNKVNADIIGIDLHWVTHCHGALELTKLYKEIHPDAKAVLGGIASTYHHEELIRYPQIDYVIRGFDTLLPMELLVKAKHEPGALKKVPNLTWKENDKIQINDMSYVPENYNAVVDWADVFTEERKQLTPYNIVIPQAGCEYNCRWCGGGSRFFKKYMGLTKKSRVHKTPELLRSELQSISQSTKGNHTVTMIDFWHQYPHLFEEAEYIFKDPNINSVHFSLHNLPKLEIGRRMAASVNAVIELSPDSHDLKVAKASGRGAYTMEQMEEFMDALIDDVYSFEIYFMLGLPEQSPENIWATVDYCEHLLRKYEGRRVYPFICPMLPFLDPGSQLFEEPEGFGYTVHHKSLEEHRQALVAMNWRDKINYETEWLSRQQLVDMSYASVRALTLLKAKYKAIPRGIANKVVELIDGTQGLLKAIDSYQDMPEGESKEIVGEDLRKKIRLYNQEMFSQIRSQQRPVDLGFTKQQWFDTEEAFESVIGETQIPVEKLTTVEVEKIQ